MYDKDMKSSWRPTEEVDSGSESQPLLSSDASRASRASFGPGPGMMFDSETSDLETGLSSAAEKSTQFNAINKYRSRLLYQGVGNKDSLAGGGGVGGGAARFGGLRGGGGGAGGERYPYYTQLPDPASPLAGQKGAVPNPVFVPYLPPEPAKQSSIVTIFAVWNTIMGTSLLAMPWGLERAGLLGGLLLMAGMGGLCLYTTWRILCVHRLHGGSGADGEVPELCRKLLGSWAELLARVFSFVVLLGAIIIYWILMSNFLFFSVDYIHAEVTGTTPMSWDTNSSVIFTPVKCHLVSATLAPEAPEEQPLAAPGGTDPFHEWWNLHTTVPIFLVLIMAPLVNFKSATFFAKFNSLGTVSVMYLMVFVLVKSAAWGVNLNLWDDQSVHYSPVFLASFPAASGMLGLSFFIHNIIITIMRSNRHQEKNGRDLSIAYVLVTLTYALIGGVFYVSFPLAKTCIEDNLLNNFESWDPMTVAARAFLFFQLVTVFPLVAYMLRAQLCTIFLGRSWPGRLPVLAINAVFLTTCVLFAVFLPRFGTIIRFTGALSGLVYVFLLPILLHLASLQRQGRLTLCTTLLHAIIPIIGGVNLIAQFFVSDS